MPFSLGTLYITMKWVVFGKTDKTRDDSSKGVPFVATIHPNLRF